MQVVQNRAFDEERAFYGSRDIKIIDCKFDGEADGESAFKESANISAENCYFNLRYPFWHDETIYINNCEMTTLCRAALWYSRNISVENSRLHGIKALRECENVSLNNVNVLSTEFGWFSKKIKMTASEAEGEYFMFGARDILLDGVSFTGKYSFQYVENAVIENCSLNTKDAFWHAKNVTVRNSVIRGEYLAWYSENLTLENCVIYGTQPFCYCNGLKLINCEMHEADLAFELSDVDATVTTSVISIKNPQKGRISVLSVGEIINDNDSCECEIIIAPQS